MSLHAQRDGSNNISLRFIHTSLAALADAYAADINIRKVSLSKLDSSSIPVKFSTPPILPSNGLTIPQLPASPTPVNTEKSKPSRPVTSEQDNERRPQNGDSRQSQPEKPQQQLQQQQQHVKEEAASHDPNCELIGEPRVAHSAAHLSQKGEDAEEGENQIKSEDRKPVCEKLESNASHDENLKVREDGNDDVKPAGMQINEQAKYQDETHLPASSPKDIHRDSDPDSGNLPQSHPTHTTLSTMATKYLPLNPINNTKTLNGQLDQTSLKRPHEHDSCSMSDAHSSSSCEEQRMEQRKQGMDNFCSNVSQPPYKKKRGPRQYKCDVCGAEFVYAGVYSKHMWKHNRYSRNSPPGELPNSSFSQGLPNLIQNMLNPQGLAVPIDMSSPAKHTTIPQQLIHSISSQTMAKAAAESLITTGNTSSDNKLQKNGHDGTLAECNNLSGDNSSDDLADEMGIGSDETLAEVHMEKKEGAGYDCWICGRPFTYKPPFIRHMRAAHEIRVIFDENRASNKTGKIFTCKLCSQSFLYQLPFEKHMKMIHGTNMDSASSKFVDIRDQRGGQMSPISMSAASSLAEQNKIISATMAVLAHQNKVLNSSNFDHISNTTFQNIINSSISAAATSHSLTLNKNSSSLQGLPQSLGCNTSLSGLTASSSSPPSTVPSLTNSPQVSPPASQKKESDYMIVDSSGNHVMFGERLQCFVCSEKFSDKRLYLVHMQNEHGIQPKEENSPFKAVGTKTGKVFTCHVCQRRFSYKGPYEKHMRSHGINLVVLDKEVTQESLYCEICGKVFAYQLPYEKHMRNIHNIEAPMKTPSPQLLYRREQRQSLQCEICFRNFSTMQSLVKHVISKHQNHLGGGVVPNSELTQSGNVDGSSASQEGSADMSAPENESGSESEDLPQRVYLDPHSVLKDLSSIIPPEDVEMGTVQQAGHPNEEDMELGQGNSVTNGKDLGLPRIEPSRITDPDSTMSMIKCDICKKMFRYKIAFSKHMQQAHPGESESANLELVNNNNEGDLDFTKGHFDQDIDQNGEVNQKEFSTTDFNKDVDMPVDYSAPKKKVAETEDSRECKPKSNAEGREEHLEAIEQSHVE